MKKLVLLTLILALSGCGVVKGVGKAVGSVCEGVGYIGTGIKDDLTSASDGHAKEYTKNHTN